MVFFKRSFVLLGSPTGEQQPSLAFQGLFFTFCCYCVFFSSGYGFREVLPLVSGIFLAWYYATEYEHSNLRRFWGKGFLVLFGVFVLFSVLTSIHPWDSFLHVGRGCNKQFLVFFLALECARSRAHVRVLAWVFLLACYLQGLACCHQYVTGFDIIHHDTLIAGRLTGTMAWYWVGSYLVLALIPAWSVFGELRRMLGLGRAIFLGVALLLPPAFGICFGGARASYLALFAALLLLFLFRAPLSRKQRLLFLLVPVLAVLLALALFGEGRLSLSTIFHDSRLTLWGFSLEVWKTDIFTGVGAWQYRPVLQSLEIAKHFPVEFTSLSHPHNVYLQVLCETGIFGFLCCWIALGGILIKAGRILLRKYSGAQARLASLAFFFWLACLAFCVHGLVGHDFFRPWYQALFFSHCGVVCGACTQLLDKRCDS